MHPRFAAFAEHLHPAFERLIACEPLTGSKRLPLKTPSRGVYLFSEGMTHLYVGRTNRLRARHREHWNPKGTHNDAPFAFKLARESLNNLREKGGLTRVALQSDPVFSTAFAAAKVRISGMDFRWVEEPDPNTQCLLEIYATIALGALYNDFDNH